MSDDEDLDLGDIDSVQIEAVGDVIVGDTEGLDFVGGDVVVDWSLPPDPAPGNILITDPNGDWTWQAPPSGIDFERDVLQVRTENIELRKRIEHLERELEGLKRKR